MENYSKKEIDVHGVYYYNSMGDYHRTDGPAVEYVFGLKFWYIIGKCHRLNGPASISSNGDDEWVINGIKYTKSCHNRLYLFSTLEPQRISTSPTKEN